MLRKNEDFSKMLKEVDFEWKDYKVVSISTTVLFLYFLNFLSAYNQKKIEY